MSLQKYIRKGKRNKIQEHKTKFLEKNDLKIKLGKIARPILT
jgi:hypothetical protein